MVGCSFSLRTKTGCNIAFRCPTFHWGMFNLKKLLTYTQIILMLASILVTEKG